MTTAFFSDTRTHAHNDPHHVEHAGRLQAVLERLQASGVLDRLDCRTPPAATDEQLLLVHSPAYLDYLAEVTATRRGTYHGGDTYLGPHSEQVARLSAGAALAAVDAIMGGAARNALVAMRPPGHHALPDHPMGFCIFANIALAALHARRAYGVRRVMIVDYDVHHGNGTQAIFYDDPGVLFLSTHQSPFYPGTGALDEIGAGAGEGTTLNIPLKAGHGDSSFHAICEQVIWPAALRYQPDLMLVSAGFDAHWCDPLGGLTLTLAGYDHLTRELIRMADAVAEGRIIFVMEGGYHLEALANGMLNVACALLDDPTVSDPLPLSERASGRRAIAGPVEDLLRRVRAIHRL
ncbi:MAG: histone deacetylase [Anaerolineae bacterium]|nr:histone deacetylase [Anaerolineae bacterium]